MPNQRRLETPAARAAAATGKNLAGAAARRRDWIGLARKMQRAVARLWSADLIRNDPQARDVMLRILATRTVDELEWEVELLSRRIAELLNRRRSATPLDPARLTGARGPRAILRKRESEDDRYSERIPRRTFLPL